MTNGIVWQGRDNRLFTVDMKWLWRFGFNKWLGLIGAFLNSASPQHLRSVQVCLYFLFRASHQKTLEIQLEPAQFTAAICFYFNGRWNCLDKWLYLTERSVFEANIAIKCVSPLGKWETVCRQWSKPISVFHWISTYKGNNALLIDWATHFPCIKVFAVWGAQFVSALVNHLKAAASP